MSQSADPDHFFQTDVSLAERVRREAKAKNNNGTPIRLPSKILALIRDPTSSSHIYVSESAGTARRIDLQSRSIKHTFRGPTAPLPCLALSTPTPSTLYAGSWDRSIYSWNIETREPNRTISNAHGDFVKCLAHAHFPSHDSSSPGLSILISGGADKLIRVWNTDTGEQLCLLRGHSMGVLSLAVDPVPFRLGAVGKEGYGGSKEESVKLLSASTDREIRQWSLTLPAPNTTSLAPVLQASKLFFDSADFELIEALKPLPTSVNQLLFFARPDASSPTSTAHDLLACSASGDIAVLSRNSQWAKDLALGFSHGEQNGVRALAVSSDGALLASAGRDEDIWLWDMESGERVGKWMGHADEVLGLVWLDDGDESGKGSVVSAGLDGTVRIWGVNRGRGEKGWIAGDLKEDEEEEEGEKQGKDSKDDDGPDDEARNGNDVELTAEEEAELAELLDSD